MAVNITNALANTAIEMVKQIDSIEVRMVYTTASTTSTNKRTA